LQHPAAQHAGSPQHSVLRNVRASAQFISFIMTILLLIEYTFSSEHTTGEASRDHQSTHREKGLDEEDTISKMQIPAVR